MPPQSGRRKDTCAKFSSLQLPMKRQNPWLIESSTNISMVLYDFVSIITLGNLKAGLLDRGNYLVRSQLCRTRARGAHHFFADERATKVIGAVVECKLRHPDA